MDVVEHFNQEHALIERSATVLAGYLNHLRQGGEEARHELLCLVTFFREVVDLGHHYKEEDLLFPELVRHGADWDGAPIADLRKEHDHERYLLRVLRQAALQTEAWSVEDRRHVIDVAGSFIEFQREHIEREASDVFPMVDRLLPAEARKSLADRLVAFDEEHKDARAISATVESLMARFVPEAVGNQ